MRFSVTVCICMSAIQASAALSIKDTALPKLAFDDPALSKMSFNLSHRSPNKTNIPIT